MKQHIVWIHGWGMSAQVWGDTASFLPDFEHHFATYEGCRSLADFQDVLMHKLQGLQGSLTVVGWSMGSMLALELLLKAEAADPGCHVADGLVWEALIVIGGTLQFVCKQRSLGWPIRVVERMHSQLQTQPEETLLQFKRAMLSEADRAKNDGNVPLEQELIAQQSDFSQLALTAGLTYLIETDLTLQWSIFWERNSKRISESDEKRGNPASPRLLWMHGEGDAICPVGAMPDLPEANRYIFPGAGHALFLTDRERFYEHLRSFLHANQ